MGPPQFVRCQICDKEFSNRSLNFHLPACISRWTAENGKKPVLSPHDDPESGYQDEDWSDQEGYPEQKPRKVNTYDNKSEIIQVTEKLDTSWPKTTLSRSAPAKSNRPSTATLKKPEVLDVSLMKSLDMTLMSSKHSYGKDNILTPRTEKSKSFYVKANVNTANVTSKSSKSDTELYDVRPGTQTLGRASPGINIPTVGDSDATDDVVSELPRTVDPLKKRSNKDQDLPITCTTCGRFQHPERLHSHPPFNKVERKTNTPHTHPHIRKPMNAIKNFRG